MSEVNPEKPMNSEELRLRVRRSPVSTSSCLGRASVLSRDVDSGFCEYDFLIPNGIVISKECDRHSTLAELKSDIWDEAIQKPGANRLRDSGHYVFIGRTRENTERELDESVELDDLELVFPYVIEISEPIRSRDLKELINKTGEAIGIPVETIEYMDARCPEQKHFRSEMMHVCRAVAREREEWSEERTLLYFYPPKLDLNKDLPLCTEKKLLKSNHLIPEVHVYLVEQGEKHKFVVQVMGTDTPTNVIEATVRARCEERGHDDETTRVRVEKAGQLYVLKVCGREDYMLKQICIHSYEYVRTCINRDEIPKLQIVSRDNLLRQVPDNKCAMLQQELPPRREPEAQDMLLSWDLPYDIFYSIRVFTQPGRKHRHIDSEMYVEAQLFNGDQPLSKAIRTYEAGYNVAWRFDVAIKSLPRTARLCFMTFTMRKGETHRNLNWVNMQVFDHTGKLVTGQQSMKVFDFPETLNVTKYPQGIPGSNWDNTAHELKFEVIDPWRKQIVYPTDQYIESIIKWERENNSLSNTTPDKTPISRIDKLAMKDPLYQLTEDEKKFLWKNRVKARDYASKLLPKLISAVNWRERHQVFQLHDLLTSVPGLLDSLTLPTVLQLLAPKCPDKMARELAVRWMRKHLHPVHIELYLLQLVQILKFESYQSNAFTKFLLEKALLYRNIGHKFFWLLRAELDTPASRPRFAVLLEAYCLHCGSAVLDQRLGEVAGLKQLSSITTAIKKKNPKPAPEDQKMLTDWLQSNSASVLQNIPSTVHPSVMLDGFSEENCRVLSSKMKPLFLTWTNRHDPSSESGEEKVRYIVKNGDDLRQDMLVGQILRVMDMLWKTSCSDFRPTIYDCLALNEDIGLIEVVEDATTLCDIQATTDKGAVNSKSLHEWLYSQTRDNIGFIQGVDQFTHSCAGFCVSTFLLGVGDRHSDNIMVKKTGELFNIDFGHFMNHKKSKANIKRERTPFILTKDFVNIITKGSKDKEKDPLFDEFLFLCFEAYMTIRNNSDLIITLLSLMMNANLPELSEEKDIRYCQRSLGSDVSDREAVKMFYGKIMESYRGQWQTKIDWYFHYFNRELKAKSSS